MFKRITTIISILIIALFVMVTTAQAAVSVRLQQPKSPNNQTSFNLTFVTLDTAGNAVTVKCFKKGPSDGGFSQFGSDIVVSSGGNTDNCQVNSSVVTTEGTYSFYVEATNGSNTATSNTVIVDVKTGGPGTPVNYGKEKITACEYKIHFRTANDSGKTVKVEVYRSENKSFNADAATKTASVALGSNTDHDFTQSVPDCNKTYYYAVRAFDSAGNGSGITGDSETIVTTNTINPTTTTQQTAAIPVSSNADDQPAVQGAETEEEPSIEPTTTETNSDIETASVDEDKGVQGASTSNTASSYAWIYALAGFVLLSIIVYLFQRRRINK